jgi:hypothetical protein
MPARTYEFAFDSPQAARMFVKRLIRTLGQDLAVLRIEDRVFVIDGSGKDRTGRIEQIRASVESSSPSPG